MQKIAINVEGLSKRYRVGSKDEIHDTFVGALGSVVRSPVRNLRRIRRLSEFDDDASDVDDVIWALRGVSLEVFSGEVVGIIGRNGAGKSTLLKILSRITEPSEGRVELRGRVSSLLEVGTGFHPELTGRENVYLNGTILGMTKNEIESNFDEIVNFSGVEKFIDTPVKFYSSGMRVRLAFSVAAHLKPEILLVDEVLAVGDAGFQRKCLGKMGEVAREGRTVLFVSHSLPSVRQLCSKVIVLKSGQKSFEGSTDQGVDHYLEEFGTQNFPLARRFQKKEGSGILSIEMFGGRDQAAFFNNEPLRFRVQFWLAKSCPDLELNISFWDRETKLFMLFGSELTCRGFNQEKPFDAGTHQIDFTLPQGLFWAGEYHVNMALHRSHQEFLHVEREAFFLHINDNHALVEKYDGLKPGKLSIQPISVEYDYGA